MDHITTTPARASGCLGPVVKDALAAAGYSQRATAEATGIPHVTLSRRLNGSSPFTVDELQSVAVLLGTSASALMRRAERSKAAS